ncbi:hypothetical protein GHT09_004013 [Marmota monax]|uniref:G-protein coupled receptors family 1 profile domain-containing protein n=1 Tax=Marmota monax TaxID=9995 RepID=A0A834PRX0_MARMO|nr:hypothetical protein GHT09_004013 [Marmota monax]
MAFDHFVAICHPLNYTVIMNPWLCVLLVLLSWLIMFWLLKATSSDTLFNIILLHVVTALLSIFPATGILYSYSQIVSSLLRMSSSVGKSKAFSTCGSHLCVVSLFYGIGLGVHLSSAMTHPSQGNMIASMTYTVLTPMLNPFIYSLRNKDVKGALGRLLSRVASCP